MQVHVQDDGECSEPILVANGVKQGCVLAPTLFSMMFSEMLAEAFSNNSDRFQTDGRLFNLCRLHAKSKVKMDYVGDLLFADDCALNTSSEPEMQQIMGKFLSACNAFGLTISTKKQK